MPRLFASHADRDLVRAERDVRLAFTGLDLDLRALAAVSNIFRAATAVRKVTGAAVGAARADAAAAATLACLNRLEDAVAACGASEADADREDEIEDRSEERRVGKECRSRWSPDH